MFQHTIQEVIAGISGAKNTRNVSDDIIRFGSSQAEHDRALDATLRRLHSSGLTVNKQKCEFNKDETEFFGFIFSARGLRPDPKKTDDGPLFQSGQWKKYTKTSGIKHHKITPRWPQANAQAESFNKVLMRAIHAAHLQMRNW